MTTDHEKAVHESRLSGIESARRVNEARRAAGVKVRVLTPIERLERSPTSLRRAVTAKCWDCQGGDADPAVRWRIGNCEVGKACPLYDVRPYQKMMGGEIPKSLRAE